MMKHPALARVFAVVLCIFAVLMLLNGTLILLETRRDHRDAVRAYDLLSSRVDEYETLTKKLEEEGPSDRKQGELDALQKQYNKDKAAHQAALAAYTATRGGLKQGQEAMAQAGLDPASLVRSEGFFHAEEGYRGMRGILDGGFIPDGVICATDTLAAGAMKALREKGLRIPEDVGIVGIGGGTAGSIIYPALTTVQLFHRESGERAADLLLTMIEHVRKNPDQSLPVTHTMLGYHLIERESV